MVGVDISQWQSGIPAGAWDFIICRATHDGLGDDLMFDQHFANALTRTTRRGAYHFANPQASSGAVQAQHFASVCFANGFRKGVDLWALDFEANALGSHAANVAWIRDFMATAIELLGARGLLYVGWPFFEETCGVENVALLHEHPWWLPAYGPNDGQPHTYDAPFVPCVHQYTSRLGGGSLDGNRVLDTVAWARLVGSQPAPKPVPPKPVVVKTVGEIEVNAKIVEISPVVLGSNGNGWVPAPGRVTDVIVVGGSEPKVSGEYDKSPNASLSSDRKVIVLQGGVPGGTYTLVVTVAQ